MNDNPQDALAVLLIGPGAAPLPKLEEEAIALLTACNSLLNALALQGAPINRNLLTDLTLFCRNGVGFGVPFADVAKRAYPNEQLDLCEHMEQLSNELGMQAVRTGTAILEVTDGANAQVEPAGKLLLELAQMELIRERICGYMGWSRILINARARMLVDQQEAAKLESGKGIH